MKTQPNRILQHIQVVVYQVKLSVNDFIIKASALSMAKVNADNFSWNNSDDEKDLCERLVTMVAELSKWL